MSRGRSGHGSAYSAAFMLIRPHLVLAGRVALAAAPIAIVATVLPRHLTLPAMSLVALAAAVLLTLFAWWTQAGRSGDRVTAWDFAGASAFIGMAAAMLSEPSHVLQLFGHATMLN